MASYDVIISNYALSKMKAFGLSESTVLDVFNNGQTEKAPSEGFASVKKYPGYEIGIMYARKPSGQWIITTVWKRDRR